MRDCAGSRRLRQKRGSEASIHGFLGWRTHQATSRRLCASGVPNRAMGPRAPDRRMVPTKCGGQKTCSQPPRPATRFIPNARDVPVQQDVVVADARRQTTGETPPPSCAAGGSRWTDDRRPRSLMHQERAMTCVVRKVTQLEHHEDSTKCARCHKPAPRQGHGSKPEMMDTLGRHGTAGDQQQGEADLPRPAARHIALTSWQCSPGGSHRSDPCDVAQAFWVARAAVVDGSHHGQRKWHQARWRARSSSWTVSQTGLRRPPSWTASSEC